MSQTSPKPYHTHRENQRERILVVAEQLFIRAGIDRVSISDIARAARMSRQTVYEYFPNKQEVAWAIFQALVEESQALLVEKNLTGGSGYQRLESLMKQLTGEMETHPEHARFIVEFNTLYSRESSPAHLLEIFQQTWRGKDNLFVQAIRQGIADGSIRAGVDPELLAAALLNLVNAITSRFALLGGLISAEYGQPAPAIYEEICRAFLRGIQANPTIQE
jgi:AcrR family transcriptional regulator